MPSTATIVVIHDAAHPLATAALFAAAIDAVRAGAEASVPVVPATEVVVNLDGDVLGAVTPPGDLALVQMPHAFRCSVLRAAHREAPEVRDEASLLVARGSHVVRGTR